MIELRAIVKLSSRLACDGENVMWSGDPVELPPKAIQVLALALHELGTNAVKYGALRQPGGQLGVTWRVQDDRGKGRVVLDWRESGVTMPGSGAAARRGYGTELIERLLPYDLGAETRLEFGPAESKSRRFNGAVL